MTPVEPIVTLLWSGSSDAYMQAIELLCCQPELIEPTSVSAAAVQDLEDLLFLEEGGKEFPRGLCDALTLRATERLLDQMSDGERAVLSPLLERIRAVHTARAFAQQAVDHGYRIAVANRDRNQVRRMVRLMLTSLEPLEERWDAWWELPHAFADLAPDIAAQHAWEQAWQQASALKQSRAEVREAARAARDQAREEAGWLELEHWRRDTWLLAPPVIRALLQDAVRMLQ